MRDIRNDLEERAKLVEREAADVCAYFDKELEELKHEHALRMGELKGELAALNVLMESEQQHRQNEPQPVEPVQQTANGSETVNSELQHIGDRIRRLQDGELARVARLVRANEAREGFSESTVLRGVNFAQRASLLRSFAPTHQAEAKETSAEEQ